MKITGISTETKNWMGEPTLPMRIIGNEYSIRINNGEIEYLDETAEWVPCFSPKMDFKYKIDGVFIMFDDLFDFDPETYNVAFKSQ